MKHTLSFLAIGALAVVLPAQATMYSVNFAGTVYQTVGATGEAVGSTVTGHFDLNSTSGSYSDFTIAGQSVAPGYQSSAVMVPAFTDAIYTAQLSPVSAGGTSNSSFSLDLSSLTFWPSGDTAFTLLTDTTQLTTNLDTVTNPASVFPSTFDYYTANANGTNIVSLAANLTSLAVTRTKHRRAAHLLVGRRWFLRPSPPCLVCPHVPIRMPLAVQFLSTAAAFDLLA